MPLWGWGAFIALLAALLSIDLVVHRGNHAPTAKRALVESAAWIACGLAFSVVVLVAWGGQAFGEYMSGYVIEKSLSIDNVFVWAIIFSTFAIPLRYQHRVLFWGIFGALTLRAAFIMGGSALITRFWWMLPVFGAILIVSGIKVVRHRDDEGTHGHDRAVKLLGRFIPVRSTLSGQRFLLREHGKLVATPLLAALVVIEVTDVVFAVDSVPAILAVSREPFIVFASNALCDPRPPRHVLPARRRAGALPLSLARVGRDPRVRRREDGGVALVAHAHDGVAGGHHRDPGRGDRVQRAQAASGDAIATATPEAVAEDATRPASTDVV